MFKNVTLEVSLKPFKRTDDEYVRFVCRQVFDQWRPLLKNRPTVSIMLWCGDGSEILDYAGDLDDEFEWCRFVGTANNTYLSEDEPRHTSLHRKKQDYTENAPVITYRILKNIVDCFKEEGKRAFPDARIRLGETFDIGPEFAISEFKYKRHTEICTGTKLDKFGFVDATATLHADDRKYAAYPDGIPEGLSFGRFLGAQSREFIHDIGFDFLWLSNGLGFSSEPWALTGKIFDGEKYYPEKLTRTKSKVFSFWKDFRSECPDVPLETRGTNNSVGIDYATDGVPLYDIYNADLDITAPPNSPWAALNDNYGLEIMGHMTRICELPSDRFPFRYYIHDPWWINSPWYDRYDGSPCDIYLPMAISRINRAGEVESANSFNILSIDNSYGTMPDACVNEPLPHILKAEKDSPDEPSAIVWVYPMREYTTTESSEILRRMNESDRYIMDAINDGFPLCTVTSTDSFLCHADSVYDSRILISPIPESKEVLDKLLRLSKITGGVIFYGQDCELDKIPDGEKIEKLSINAPIEKARGALARLGYEITFAKVGGNDKPTTLAISRAHGAFWFSAYNANTTTEARFLFPFGAPILCGGETEIKDGRSSYRFIRGEHRECRVFLRMDNGVVSLREWHPGNVRYRRRLKLEGLTDATVRVYTEPTRECAIVRGNDSEWFDAEFIDTKIDSDVYGTYIEAEHLNGEFFIVIGHDGTL